MSKQRSPRKSLWLWVQTRRLAWRRSSTSSHLRKVDLKLDREVKRQQLLQQLLDSSLLMSKELEEQQLTLEHRLRELAASQVFRTQGLMEIPPPPSALDQQLELGSTPLT